MWKMNFEIWKKLLWNLSYKIFYYYLVTLWQLAFLCLSDLPNSWLGYLYLLPYYHIMFFFLIRQLASYLILLACLFYPCNSTLLLFVICSQFSFLSMERQVTLKFPPLSYVLFFLRTSDTKPSTPFPHTYYMFSNRHNLKVTLKFLRFMEHLCFASENDDGGVWWELAAQFRIFQRKALCRCFNRTGKSFHHLLRWRTLFILV